MMCDRESPVPLSFLQALLVFCLDVPIALIRKRQCDFSFFGELVGSLQSVRRLHCELVRSVGVALLLIIPYQ